MDVSVRPSLRPPRLSVRPCTRWLSKPSGAKWSDRGPFGWLPKRPKWLFSGKLEGPWVALYPAGKIPQYYFHYEIGRRVGLKPILASLKSLLTLIRLKRKLKPSGRLYPFLLGIYKFRVGLWLISLGLYILWPRRRRKKRGGKRRGRRGGRRRKGGGSKGKSGGGIKGGREGRGGGQGKG